MAFYFQKLLVFSTISLVHVRYIHDHLLNGRSTFSEESLDRFLLQMDRLEIIQSEILGINQINRMPLFDGVEFEDDIPTIEQRPELLPYLFEGDIVLTDEQMQMVVTGAKEQLNELRHAGDEDPGRRRKRTMVSAVFYKWHNFPINYSLNIASGVDAIAVKAGIKHWEENTCITFKETTKVFSNGAMIEFINGNGCYSNIGRYPFGTQQLSIGVGCTSVGTVAHEIGHALGFFHEQSRYDRDEYVRILGENIEMGYANQFTKHSSRILSTYGVEYDLGSVMHYDQKAFSADHRNTIETIDPNFQNTIGQRVRLSFSDIKKVNYEYCNDTCKEQLSCHHGGYTDPKNCSRCRCPEGLGHMLCDRPLETTTECGPLEYNVTTEFQTLMQDGLGECNFLITAPLGKKIFIEFNEIVFRYESPCSSNYVEVRYGNDLSTTGARLCAEKPIRFFSKKEQILILYRGSSDNHFKIRYRYGDVF